jgi:ADP-heptose:LPS heptosyltransferase
MPGILIIKLGALGDILMAGPTIRRIQEHHAGQQVHVLTGDEFRDIFARWPGIIAQGFPRRGAGAMLRAIFWIRANNFDRIYDLQSSDRSGLLCALSGVRERAGNHQHFPYSLRPATPWRGAGHIHDRWREVLRSAGVDPGPLPAWLPIQESDWIYAESWLQKHRLTERRFAILHAGTSADHPEKRWPYFGELATAIRSAGTEVVWAGGPADRGLNRTLSGHGGIDASCDFSLMQLAALGSRARFAVTNDSAPMHALACAGIPVFGLFGPTDWRRNHAIGQRENVIMPGNNPSAFVPAPLAALPATAVADRLRAAGLIG